MTASRTDLLIDQGADYTAHIYWLDENNIPYYIQPPIRMEIRTQAGQLVESFVAGVAGDNNTSDLTYNADNGMIQLWISASRTSAIGPGTYYYDLFTNYLDGAAVRTNRLIEGRVEVRRKITNG